MGICMYIFRWLPRVFAVVVVAAAAAAAAAAVGRGEEGG